MKRLLIFIPILFFSSLMQSRANDDLQVSLLTVMPRSKAVYTIYGHTALRLYSPSRSIDAVLNWGTFDTGKPNFIYHFLLGETDYFLSVTSTESFMIFYQIENVTVVEQVLDIPDRGKELLLQMVQTNFLPENIEYRYNIFFNNCTTRPRDIIEKICGGTLIYPKLEEPVTIRNLVHGCTKHYPWMEFGIDLIIGSGADSLISVHTEMFLPERLMDLLGRSFVKTPDSAEYPLIRSSQTILLSKDNETIKDRAPFAKPLVVTIIILLIYICTAIFGFNLRGGVLLFLFAALAGCIIAAFVFLSDHPCTSPNWNMLWLHPLHLIGFVGFLYKKQYAVFRWYHGINFTLLSGFLLGWYWIPQALNIAFIPLIGCLWLVSGQYLFSRSLCKLTPP
ncbi:MAG: DUF4105 domain-containing protein [Dysgonamonadaceae bacterium]|jgi:hypothetical protein|nr:DUF4105 domain-containing protein [Dysgonamonadaceae bacterium]